MRAHKLAIAIFCLLVSICACAQQTTGAPAFATLTGSPDVLNVGNLNAQLNVPVLTKSGRGLDFYYVLSYNSLIWRPVGSNGNQYWQPDSNWGWSAQTDTAVGYVTTTVVADSCDYFNGRNWVTYHYNTTFYYGYTDKFGTYHPFQNLLSGGPAYPCNPQTSKSTHTVDGSGYMAGLTGGVTFSLAARDGTPIQAPLVKGASTGVLKDSNGNKVTTDGTNFTDTLGTTALTISGSAPNPLTLSSPVLGAQPVTISYLPHNIQTAFNCKDSTGATIGEYGASNVNLVDKVTLPDGSFYQLGYDGSGRVTKITLPTGGTITYSYNGANNGIVCTDGSTLGLTRSTSADGTSTEGTWTYSRAGSGSTWTTTIFDPLNRKTVVNFQGIYETHRDVYDDSTGTKRLLTVDTCYNGATPNCSNTPISLPITSRAVTTTLDNNQVSRITTSYYTTSTLATDLPTEVDETDFGSGSPGNILRKTKTTYNSMAKPTGVSITDASDVPVAYTGYGYDETTPSTTSGVPQHDPVSTPRGNLTSISRTGGSSPVTYYTYDDTGNVTSVKDPNGNITTFGYGNSNAYVTSVSMPTTGSVAHTTSAIYDSNTGLKTQDVDQNSQPTIYAFDSINRISSITYPDGGKKTFTYPDAKTTEVQTLQSGSSFIDQFTYLDGLGRRKQTRTIDPEGDDLVDYAYNALGQILSVTNPHRSTSSTTDGLTQYSYDGLSRTSHVTLPDSNTVQTAFSGPCITTTDQAGRQSQRCSDALGRLAQVTEPNPSTGSLTTGGYQTSYAYDLLNNLKQVTQNGDNSANKRLRTFAYDSLSRMTSMQMPESGTTTFDSYDANGNLLQQTDARGVKTTLSYDALNRLTGKTFSDGTKPVSIYYDQSSNWSNTLTNPIGRVTTVTRGSPFVSGTVYSYDAVGRVVKQLDCRPSNCGTSAFKTYYAYDLVGNLTSVTYPSGRVVTYSFTPSNALSAVNFASYGASSVNYPYESIPSHYPTLDPATITYGNGLTDTVALNSRLQRNLYQLAAGSQNLMKRSYNYYNGSSQNNGNLWNITDQLRSGGNQTFAYDYLNRLTSASQSDSAYSETFTYDAWGNLKQSGTWSFQNNYDTTNRIVTGGGFAYDANGNLTSEGTTNHTFSYDAENHMATVDTTAATYTYGADGLRDRKDASATYSEYIYMGATAIAEKNESGDWTDYIVGPTGRTIKAEGLDRGLKINGTNSGSGQYSLFYFSGAGGLSNYTVQNGDKLYLTQYQQTGSKGGIVIGFTDSTNTNWNARDNSGYYANDDQSQGTTHKRTIDLSSFAGKKISTIAANSESDTVTGAWAIIYEQVSLVSADGTVHPLFTGQSSSPLGAGTGSSGVTGRGSTVDTNRNKAIYPTTTTTYYHTDAVGTARLISQGGGWPVWQGVFAPFGQEISPQISIDNNKFATYQHEDESNLEHGVFRQYAGIEGRFTSPDPYFGSVDIGNPQSWNRYVYTGNTPTTAADPLGLFVHDCMWTGCSGGGTGPMGGGYYGGLSSPCSLDGVATDCGSIGSGLGSNGIAYCPQCGNPWKPAGVGADNHIYEWLASGQPKDCSMTYCPATGYSWVDVGKPFPPPIPWAGPSVTGPAPDVISRYRPAPGGGSKTAVAGSVTFPIAPGIVGTVPFAFIPNGDMCLGLGGGFGSPGFGINGGVVHTTANNIEDVLSGPSVSAAAQSGYIGAQTSHNSAGLAVGNSMGTPGVSLTVSYSVCF